MHEVQVIHDLKTVREDAEKLAQTELQPDVARLTRVVIELCDCVHQVEQELRRAEHHLQRALLK